MDPTMQRALLCCLVALAIIASEGISYVPSLNFKKTYSYKYEGVMNFGRGMPDMAESGIKITCMVQIIGITAQTFLLQVSELAVEEFSGLPGKSPFNASPKLTKRVADLLVKPFMFEYVNGHVGQIHAPTETPDTVVNIVRGIVGFFQVTVKTTQRVNELEEVGIHGMCQSNYAIDENIQTKDMIITQVVDLNNCRQKAEHYSGMASAVVDHVGTKKGDSVISTVRYIYTVKPSEEGGLIAWAQGLEQQHFSPFNVKGGSFKMQAMKELILLGVTNTAGTPTPGPMVNKGNLVHKFVTQEFNIPIMMQNLMDPVPKVIEMIKHLAQANIYGIDNATTEDTFKIIQLLRVVSFEDLDAIWKQFAGNEEHRRWFLNMIVEINDARILKFLELRFNAEDVSTNEAWQMVLLTFNHLQAKSELVELAKGFLTMPFCKANPQVWHTVVLSYGSLVYKLCAYNITCPMAAVQPLLDMAKGGLTRGSEDDMVLALKALGNAGHPGSIKTIMNFLPGVAANPVKLSDSVLSAAVQSMRLIAVRDPHKIQDITMNLFVQKDLPAEIRIQAFIMLFETKPPMALVFTLAAHLQEEKDLHVASFAFSFIRSVARSSTPDNQLILTACTVAAKILEPKFGRLSFHYSKAFHMDWFSENLLIGTTMETFLFRNANMFATEIVMKQKLHLIGRILQYLEIGIRAEGIKELFGATFSGFKGDFSLRDIQAIFSVLKNWETLPDNKPLLSFYSRATGQEWLLVNLYKDVIQSFIKAFSPSAGKESSVFGMIEHLQRGFTWHQTKAFLMLETRYFQATTLGLPVEISKYIDVVNGITVNAKAAINPPVNEHVGQLLTSEISMETDGFIGFTKDILVFHGINTELFQCGTELKSKISASVPWRFNATVNVRERKFDIDFPPCREEYHIFSVHSNVFAVFRNAEEATLAKITPLVPIPVELVTSNMWNPIIKMCADSSVYGAGVCLDSVLKRAYYDEGYPLSYITGYTQIAVNIVPVTAINPVDKIHIEVNARPIAQNQLLETLKSFFTEATRQFNHSSGLVSVLSAPEAALVIKALAVSGTMKPQGFDAVVYYTPQANIQNTQLIVTKVGDEANWKMCTDAVVDDVHAEANFHIRWGAECQTYEMSMKVASARTPGSLPAVRASVHWTKIPEYMAEMSSRIGSYVPGMAFLLGFYKQHESNVKQEIFASVATASPHSVDVWVKFPEYTVYRQGIPVPFQIGDRTGNITLDTEHA